MESATAILGPEDEPFAVDPFFSGAVAFVLDAEEELLFFNGGGAAGSAGGALRLRNSTILFLFQRTWPDQQVPVGRQRGLVVQKGFQ